MVVVGYLKGHKNDKTKITTLCVGFMQRTTFGTSPVPRGGQPGSAERTGQAGHSARDCVHKTTVWC